jgi:hypothetical protein
MTRSPAEKPQTQHSAVLTMILAGLIIDKGQTQQSKAIGSSAGRSLTDNVGLPSTQVKIGFPKNR